jgi:alkyl hydroperoxide reductase subunit AhpF
MTIRRSFISSVVCLLAGFISISNESSFAQTRRVDVLVVGGGAGGTASGIQAARSGARTLIVESTPWLGGMLMAGWFFWRVV